MGYDEWDIWYPSGNEKLTIEAVESDFDAWPRVPPFSYDYRNLEPITPLMKLNWWKYGLMSTFIDLLIKCLPDHDLDKPSLASLLLALSPRRRFDAQPEDSHTDSVAV